MKQSSKLKRFIIGFAFLFILAKCSVNKMGLAYSLSGKIKGIDSGWIYVKHRQINQIDSAKIENGKFTIFGKAISPEFCNIGTGNSGKRAFYFGFFLQSGNMKMTANKDSLFDAAVSFEGSPTQDEFKQFQQKMRFVDNESYQIFLAGKTSNDQDSLNFKAKMLENLRKEMIWNYALNHPNSFISAFEAASYLTEKEDLPKLDSIFNRISPKLQKWFYSEKINQRLRENGFGNKK